MKRNLKKIFKKGLLITIGGVEVELPFNPRWPGVNTLVVDIKDLINFMIALGSVVAVAMIVVSGYTLITSAGDPEKASQGQKTLTGAIIGLIIVWVAGLLVKFVLTELGTI